MGKKKPFTKFTSEHMAKIGRAGGLKTKRRRGKEFFQEIARMSHPRERYPGKKKVKRTNDTVADHAGDGARVGGSP